MRRKKGHKTLLLKFKKKENYQSEESKKDVLKLIELINKKLENQDEAKKAALIIQEMLKSDSK